MAASDVFFLDEFAERQWTTDESFQGTRLAHIDRAEFVRRVHEAHAAGAPLHDGYAPFCKHIFIPNFVGAKVGTLPITSENEHLLRSGYNARTPAELPVLTRWFPKDSVGEPPEAAFLDVILYSREQIALERSDMAAKQDRAELPEGVPWGIISIKAQAEGFETPMQPITMMRNALGREEGGSGVSLSRDKYTESVTYWSNNAPIV
eukprot:CAMPEP_0170161954 /NCGR_PEP_ID=MMETSP0033_2-20121228/76851_1 /TAXON_ID=195969 /ORGANISM="Dolichomastix tenuilepis, Strain CCMP3274" /LENGTH=205 /DNA_ID=CAMNT_0010399579 /DNA_START=477 /DNA_END=1094 /DNA_ORIENTATION=-